MAVSALVYTAAVCLGLLVGTGLWLANAVALLLLWGIPRGERAPHLAAMLLAGASGYALVGSLAAHWDPPLDALEFTLSAIVAVIALSRADRPRPDHPAGITRAALAEAEARWKFALATSEQGVWDVNFVAGDAFHSPRWKAILGYGPHELQDHVRLRLDLVHPEDRPKVEALDREHRDGRLPTFEAEFRMRHKDGRWIWVRDRGQVVARDRQGRALRAIGTLSDITEQKTASAELAHLAERVQLATDAAAIGLFELGSGGRTLWWNERMHDLHGTDPRTFRPTLSGWRRLIHPEDVDRVIGEALATLAGAGRFDTEYRIVRGDGEVRHIRVVAKRPDAPDGQAKLVGANWDVTLEREATERLKRANDDIGQFAAIASHDLQAPLRQIALWADVVKQDTAGRLDPENAAMLDRIRRRALRMRQMIIGLLEFSRAGTQIRLEPVDLTQAATEAVADHALELAEIGGSAVVEPLPRSLGDPVLLGQIFGNLISNAIKYRSEAPLQLVISGHAAPGSVVVTVRDNGIGIDPGYADAVFELFRRLPEAAGLDGAGIGLAVCRRMAEAMGGDISLDSTSSNGTMFILRLRPVPDVLARVAALEDRHSTAA